MYEDSERKIDWISVLKRLAVIIVAILVILGFISLVTKCSRNDSSKTPTSNEPIDLTAPLNEMQAATLKYVTKENLPSSINSSKTIKLKYLINENIVKSIKDSNGNVCSTDKSYSEITRLENNYAVRVEVSCKDNTAYRVIYIGCFDSCENDGICLGDENSTGGICTIQTEEETNNSSNTSSNTNNTSNNSTSTPTKPSNSNTSSSSSNKPSNSNGNSSSNSNSSSSISKQTLYEYKKCSSNYTCSKGTLNSNNMCEYTTTKTLYCDVVKTGGETVYTSSTVAAQKKTSTSTVNATVNTSKYNVYLSSTSVKNTATKTYTYQGYVKGYGYKFLVTEKKYSCSKGTLSGTQCVISTIEYVCPNGSKSTTGTCVVSTKSTTPVKYGCADPSYTYTSVGTCTKKEQITKTVKPSLNETCETQWSPYTSLNGWIRTGNTK